MVEGIGGLWKFKKNHFVVRLAPLGLAHHFQTSRTTPSERRTQVRSESRGPSQLSLTPQTSVRGASVAVLSILFIGLLIYSNSFTGSFCSDDYNVILNNPAVENLKDIPGIWRSFNTRFLVGVSFAFNYWLGEYDVLGYHIFNLVFHLLASVCVYYFVLLTFETPALKESNLKRYQGFISFFSALIFLTHPIQTQGVSYITQRAVAMAAVFYLSTFILYIKARLEKRPLLFFLAFLMMVGGMLTKETALTIPFVLAVYEFSFFGNLKTDFKKRLKILLPFLAGVVIFFLIFSQDRDNSTLQLKGQILSGSFDGRYLLTEINVLRTYLRLIFLPIHQHHEYKYPLSQSLFEWPTVLSFVLIAAIIGFAISQYKQSRLISFSIFWFFMTMALEVIHPCFVKKGLIYEHWLYVAVAGFAVFLPTVLIIYVRSERKAKAILASVVIVFSIFTFERNKVWQNEFTLWQDNIQKSPNNPTGYFALGVAYGKAGDFVQERLLYEKALSLDSDYYEAYNNLAVVYLKHNQLDKTVEYCQKALAVKPNYPEPLATLGAVYYLNGQNTEAKDYLQRAVTLYEASGIFYKANITKRILAGIP